MTRQVTSAADAIAFFCETHGIIITGHQCDGMAEAMLAGIEPDEVEAGAEAVMNYASENGIDFTHDLAVNMTEAVIAAPDEPDELEDDGEP